MRFIKAELLNPGLRISAPLPIGLRPQHFRKGIACFVKLSLVDVQDGPAQLRFLIDVRSLFMMSKDPFKAVLRFIPAAAKLRRATAVQLRFARPRTVWMFVTKLTKKLDRVRVIMLVPFLDGLSEKQIVILLLFTLVSVSNLCRICRC